MANLNLNSSDVKGLFNSLFTENELRIICTNALSEAARDHIKNNLFLDLKNKVKKELVNDVMKLVFNETMRLREREQDYLKLHERIKVMESKVGKMGLIK